MSEARSAPRLLAFDAVCLACLRRIHAREEPAREKRSARGLHRGWVHAECAPDAPHGERSPGGRSPPTHERSLTRWTSALIPVR